MDIKYDYRKYGDRVFRIKMTRISEYDGMYIRYEIQEPAAIPHNFWERLKQFFTVATYYYGHWVPSIARESLDKYIYDGMKFVVNQEDRQTEAAQTWANLK